MNRRDFLRGLTALPALGALLRKALTDNVIEIELEDELEAWDKLSDEACVPFWHGSYANKDTPYEVLVSGTGETINPYLIQDVSIHEVTGKKIQSFKELKKGWHYGEGVPFQQSVLDEAISLNREAVRLAFYETDAFPGTDGEIMLVIYSGNHALEFVFERDGSVTFCHEKGDKEICYQEGLSSQDARGKIAEFREKIGEDEVIDYLRIKM